MKTLKPTKEERLVHAGRKQAAKGFMRDIRRMKGHTVRVHGIEVAPLGTPGAPVTFRGSKLLREEEEKARAAEKAGQEFAERLAKRGAS